MKKLMKIGSLLAAGMMASTLSLAEPIALSFERYLDPTLNPVQQQKPKTKSVVINTGAIRPMVIPGNGIFSEGAVGTEGAEVRTLKSGSNLYLLVTVKNADGTDSNKLWKVNNRPNKVEESKTNLAVYRAEHPVRLMQGYLN